MTIVIIVLNPVEPSINSSFLGENIGQNRKTVVSIYCLSPLKAELWQIKQLDADVRIFGTVIVDDFNLIRFKPDRSYLIEIYPSSIEK